MFTGIIQDTGRLVERDVTPEGGRIVVSAPSLRASMGESVAVEGVCLTVTDAQEGCVSFDLTLETLRLTTLGLLAEGRRVNLETGLRLGDPLGGHIVQGHVDGRGTVDALMPEGDGWRLQIEAPDDLSPHLAPKGSLTVNGVSLTIAWRQGRRVAITLIPHTWRMTTLSLLSEGDPVNLEVDVISRYLETLLAKRMDKEATNHVPLD